MSLHIAVGSWSITCESYCVIKVGFVVPNVASECTDIFKQLSAKIDGDEGRGEWEQNRKKGVFVVARFVGNITWLSSSTHAHIIFARERTSLGPWVIRTCSEVIVFFCGFIVGLTGALQTWPVIVFLYSKFVSAVFDGSFADSTEMGVASSLCLWLWYWL